MLAHLSGKVFISMRKFFTPLIILFVAIICFMLSACKPKPSALEKYDRSVLLTSLADSVILPSYNNFNQAALALKTAADTFSNVATSSNLSALRTAWNTTLKAWMHCEPLNFEYANANSLNSQIASVPVNFPVIENEIHGTVTLDESYIAATGTTRKGMAAIEYLLYGNSGLQQSVIDSFTLSTTLDRRKQYLRLLCQHVYSYSSSVYSDWNHGNSYDHFISQTQLDISGSLNLLVNALTEHIEYVRKSKLGKPAGIDNNGSADGTLCEYNLSESSLENIKENIAAWKTLFTCNAGIGLDDYLDFVDAKYNGTPLSQTITQQLDLCLNKANDITVPLNLAVTQQPTQVNALYLELKKITVLTKVDLASNLGVVITFSDNDGD